MERLRQRDLDALFPYLHELYAHRDLEGFKSSLARIISGIVPSKFNSYNEVDLCAKTATWVPEPTPPDHVEVGEALNVHLGEHPLSNHYLKTGEERAIQISDFLSQREFSRLGLYDEYFGRLGTDRCMAMSLSITPSLLVGIAFCRDGRDFSERERLTLDTLRPHLIQAYRNAVAVERNRLELQSLHRALEEMDKGVVSLSREGRLEMATERARRLLAEYFRPPARPEELPEDLRRWVQGQLSLLCRGDDAPPPRKPLVLERGCERITIRFVDDGAQEGGGYMLLLEEQLPPLSPQDLASSLGLTRREGEVLHLVARGETDQQVASSLHLSTRTVNKHLQNIYRKFGVSRRAEAIARTLEVSDTHRS